MKLIILIVKILVCKSQSILSKNIKMHFNKVTWNKQYMKTCWFSKTMASIALNLINMESQASSIIASTPIWHMADFFSFDWTLIKWNDTSFALIEWTNLVQSQRIFFSPWRQTHSSLTNGIQLQSNKLKDNLFRESAVTWKKNYTSPTSHSVLNF